MNTTNKDLMKLDKAGLIRLIKSLCATIRLKENALIRKTGQIRHFRLRLYKIRNSIDYMLTCPSSADMGYRDKRKLCKSLKRAKPSNKENRLK